MSNYFTLKNRGILNPPTGTDLGSGSNKFANVYIGNQLTVGTTTVDSTSIGSIKIAGIAYPGDDTAADTAGGQTITITGSGFAAGASVIIDGAAVSVVTVVSSTQITFTAPAKTAGSYSLYVINPDGATAISVVGIQFSGVPAWITAAGSLSTIYEGDAVNTQLAAAGDAPVIYSLASGSLPGGLTLAGNGKIIGTANTVASSTTYNFTVKATDYQNQDTNRAFSYTVNPESVTFNTPGSNQTYSNAISDSFSLTLSATSSAGKSIAYTANALPTGLSLSGATISGTLSGAGTTSSLITATAVGSVKTATRTLTWAVTSPQLTVDFMVVAGGGPGGSGAGGGAGGYRTSVGTSGGGASAETALTVNRGTTYTVTVGAGAAPDNFLNGGNSVFATVTSLGGAFGYYSGQTGGSGSGNGNSDRTTSTNDPGARGGAGTAGQGYYGGYGMYGATSPNQPGGGGGGGGAGGQGGNGYYWNGGNGGTGVQTSITGTATYYAGGGGGGGARFGSRGYGGTGGGGDGGGGSSNLNGSPGTANTGGGGGGNVGYYNSSSDGYQPAGAAASGGSGIVVLRTADSVAAAASTTGSPTITVAGGYRVYKWTSSGSVTF
jgi:hypothetical protein